RAVQPGKTHGSDPFVDNGYSEGSQPWSGRSRLEIRDRHALVSRGFATIIRHPRLATRPPRSPPPRELSARSANRPRTFVHPRVTPRPPTSSPPAMPAPTRTVSQSPVSPLQRK